MWIMDWRNHLLIWIRCDRPLKDALIALSDCQKVCVQPDLDINRFIDVPIMSFYRFGRKILKSNVFFVITSEINVPATIMQSMTYINGNHFSKWSIIYRPSVVEYFWEKKNFFPYYWKATAIEPEFKLNIFMYNVYTSERKKISAIKSKGWSHLKKWRRE